jgi:hypothetical protein
MTFLAGLTFMFSCLILFTTITLTLNYSIMKWYLAKMVFRIICGEGEHTPQFDEQLAPGSGSEQGRSISKSPRDGDKGRRNFL